MRRLVRMSEPLSAFSADFGYLTASRIATIPRQNSPLCNSSHSSAGDQSTHPDRIICVPGDASDLQLRSHIMTHASPTGHRGCDAMDRQLNPVFSIQRCRTTSGC